jgi:cytochrome P450
MGNEALKPLDSQDPAFIENPYTLYSELRESKPVALAGENFWVVTGREEMMAVLRDHDRFTSRRNLDGAFAFSPEARQILEEALFFRVALLNVEPPEHTRFRALINDAFTPRNLRMLEPSIRSLAAGLADGFAGDQKADLLRQFAYPLPMTVICDIMGIPAQDRAMVKQWNNAWLALQVLPLPPEQQVAFAGQVLEYMGYFRSLLEERKRRPGEDLLSRLTQAAQQPDPVCTDDDVLVSMRVLLAAGHETTTNLIANTALHLLWHHDLWDAAVRDQTLIPAAIEEGLRYDSSVQGTPRFATEDLCVGGTTIPAGAKVQAMVAAAGHDPEWVEDPDAFRLDRPAPARHHGFGYGIHFCPGAPLARLESRIAFETLTRRFPGMTLEAGYQPSHMPGGFVFHGLTALPVTW